MIENEYKTRDCWSCSIKLSNSALKSEVMRRVASASQLKPYRGIGELWRMASQYTVLRRWEREYQFKSACEVPYQNYVWGVDGHALDCFHRSYRRFNDMEGKFDLVWNFCVIQQDPRTIYQMIQNSNKYVASFVPNSLNIGRTLHGLYHFVHKTRCTHPDRGDKSLMTLRGLIHLYKNAGIRILEAGYCDMPPQPDWVISLRNFFKPADLETPYRSSTIVQVLEKVFWFDQANPLPKRIWAHHPYVFGGI